MVAELVFLGWIAVMILMVLALRAWRKPSDGVRVFQLVLATVLLAVVAACIITPPDFGGVVLILLGLSLGGSAGAVFAERASDAKVPAAFALARATGMFGCLWVVAAALYAPASVGVGAGRSVFLSLLLAADFAAMAFAGLVLMALPGGWAERLRAGLRRVLPGLVNLVIWALVVTAVLVAVLCSGLTALCLSAALLAIAVGLYVLSKPDVDTVLKSAWLDGFCAAAVGMLGFALGDAMLIAVGGFATAASFAIAQRARRRSA